MFKIDYTAEGVLQWSRTADGVQVDVDADYRPTLYAEADDWATLEDVRSAWGKHPKVATTRVEEWRPGWRETAKRVLAIDATDIDAVDALAQQFATWERPGTIRLYNVDFSREFRYALETGTPPTATEDLRTLSIDVPVPVVESDTTGLTEATIDGEQTVTGEPVGVMDTILDRIDAVDPDVLILSTAAIIPELFATAAEHEVGEIEIGRRPGYEQLAQASTYESYGQTGHSPARYNVPGRAIIDTSNTFFYHETNLAGVLDLVARSWKPLQELAWASIGNVLTAMQIREARAQNVLVPWRSWRHEQFKTMRQLHEADRGGHIMAPDVGLHEDVHELDFASLYPNIIVTRNISPETIRCDCHDTDDVPDLGYAICEDDGYLPDVLEPLIDDREEIKAEIRQTDDPERRRRLEGRSDAIKWILVSCFGYQGFSNAKFGRIEAHEAINAFAREILLDAKARLEDGGWRVLHGIVDSIWVTPREGVSQEPLDAIADEITAAADIRLDYEGAYDWVAFVPMKDSAEGALTKYFGKKADPPTGDDPFKFRGIETRQRSTPAWVGAIQRDLIATLDTHRAAEPVLETLAEHLRQLERGAVDPERLTITNRVSKRLEEYTQATRNVAALERAKTAGLEKHPGQNVEYVVVDDTKASQDRVRLQHETPQDYDTAFYRTQTIRAAESVLSPLGWRADDIHEWLSDLTTTHLQAFEAPSATHR